MEHEQKVVKCAFEEFESVAASVKMTWYSIGVFLFHSTCPFTLRNANFSHTCTQALMGERNFILENREGLLTGSLLATTMT